MYQFFFIFLINFLVPEDLSAADENVILLNGTVVKLHEAQSITQALSKDLNDNTLVIEELYDTCAQIFKKKIQPLQVQLPNKEAEYVIHLPDEPIWHRNLFSKYLVLTETNKFFMRVTTYNIICLSLLKNDFTNKIFLRSPMISTHFQKN